MGGVAPYSANYNLAQSSTLIVSVNRVPLVQHRGLIQLNQIIH